MCPKTAQMLKVVLFLGTTIEPAVSAENVLRAGRKHLCERVQA